MTTALPLADVLAALTPSGDAFTLDAPAGWGQGRTLYGGMTAALCWAAAARAFPDLPPLRSMQIGFVGPASGVLTLTPVVLRQGRSAMIVGVDAVGEAGLAARAIFTCGAVRASDVAHHHQPAPVVPAPDVCDSLFPAGAGPDFAAHFEMRLAAGSRPFCGGKPEFTVWARLRHAGGADPLTALLALADALPPAAMVVFPRVGRISTMSWSVDSDGAPLDAGAWVLLQSVSESTEDGYSRQVMRAWDADGARLLSGMQTVAVFV